MLEIEEVIVNPSEVSGYADAEYLNDEPATSTTPVDIKVKMHQLQMSQSANVPGRQDIPAERKVPIIRKAGEVVTPAHKTSGVITVSPSILKVPAVVRPKTEWSKVSPPGLKTPLSLSQAVPVDNNRMQTLEHMKLDIEDYSQDGEESQEPIDMYEQSGSTDMAALSSKLTRIEHLLERVVAKQAQHDTALNTLKFHIKDLQTELRSSGRAGKRMTTDSINETSYSAVPLKRDRKRMVVFPVVDDNYLLRLDDLVQVNEEIRADLISLFDTAPKNSAYEFLRKNCQSLFEHTSKYTWTGKSVHNHPNVPASNPAHKLAIVKLLISCACEKFPHLIREAVEKEFRRALTNFNESRVIRLKRKMNESTTETVDDGEHTAE